MKHGVTGSRIVGELEEIAAETLLREIIRGLNPVEDEWHHGGADGIDLLSKRIAQEFGFVDGENLIEHVPTVRSWAAKGGFRDRNMTLVQSIDKLYALHSSSSRSGGTIWTYNYAQRCHRATTWYELEEYTKAS